MLQIDPELAPPQLLVDLNNNLTTVLTQIKALAADRNRQHVKQASPPIGIAVQQVMSLPLLETPEKVGQSFSEVLLAAKASADKIVADISNKSKELEGSILRLQEQAASLAAEVQSSKERTDSMIAEYQKQFSESESGRAKRFETHIEQTNKQAAAVIDTLELNTKEASDQLEAAAESLLNEMRVKKEIIENLARAMGATGISATFQATANKNQWAADMLRGIAIALLIVSVCTILWAVWHADTLGLESTLTRFLAAFLVSIPATYLARESTRQRAEAVRSRRIEVELASLGPFIEPLDDAKKADLQERLVNTYFGRAFDKEEIEEDSIPLGGTALEFVKALKDLAKKS